MDCPLTDEQTEDIHQPLPQLIRNCRRARCGFVDSDHDTDRLPGGCILLVVALLTMPREKSA